MIEELVDASNALFVLILFGVCISIKSNRELGLR